MEFKLKPLGYDYDALEPHISAETLKYHYDKHHQGYMDKLEKAIKGKPLADKSLEEIVCNTEGSTFNSAAQVWNHDFYWRSMTPGGGGQPDGDVKEAIEKHFKSVDDFKREFAEAAKNEFGSGWAWLLADGDKLRIASTTDAENPLTGRGTPLITIDVWEHAYYLDYQNERAKYVDAYVEHLINWDFVAENLRQLRRAA